MQEIEGMVAWNHLWREPVWFIRTAEHLIVHQINSDPSWWLGTPCTSHFPFLPFKLPGCEDHGTLVEVCWGHNTSEVTAPLMLFGRKPLNASIKYLPLSHPERALCLWPLFYAASHLPTTFWCDRASPQKHCDRWHCCQVEHSVLSAAAFSCSVTVARDWPC